MEIPEGYKENPKGHLIPVATISPLELIRDEQVNEIVRMAEELQAAMRKAKLAIIERIREYMTLAAQEYGMKVGSEKGQVTLASYDGKKKVQIAIADNIAFDERITLAQTLITECLREWSADGAAELRALVEQAFTADRQGNINRWLIMRLLKIQSENPKWQEAMRAIKDSMYADGSKAYLRLYQRRPGDGKAEQMNLDLASLPVE